MTDAPLHQMWWTAEEIATAHLPDLPDSKRGVQGLAKRQNWTKRPGCVRRRAGKGGGYEYHFSLFPARARDQLSAQAIAVAPTEADRQRTEGWAAFEAMPDKAKTKARDRAEICADVLEFEKMGQKRTYAVQRVAVMRDVSAGSIYSWLKKVERQPRDDWPIHLAGRHRAAIRTVEKAEIDDLAWEYFKKDYLRPEAPTLSSVYRRMLDIGGVEGWTAPSEQTMRRLIRARIPKDLIVYTRQGSEALKRMTPALIRDKSHLYATQLYEADYHRWDVFVEWEPGNVIRPQMCAFKDVYSGKTVAWRHSETPNSLTVSLTLGDAIENFGIPSEAYFDNGMEFAAKWLTGGTSKRFRGRVREDDPTGVYHQLGIEVHFTQPYSGQSKTIERTFRDHCADIAKDPRFRGAYVGNRPDAKPENYGDKAIPRDVFERVVAGGVAEFNAREGRRSPVAAGRSFDEVFAQSYAAAPVRKATKEQRRIWLLGGQKLKAKAADGELSLDGNKYWDEWCRDIGGETIFARFDPENLHSGLHVYRLDGTYLGYADCRQRVGYNSREAAQAQVKLVRSHNKLMRKLKKVEIAMTDADQDRLLDSVMRESSEPDAKIITPDFSRKTVSDIMKPDPVETPVREATAGEVAAQEATVIALTQKPQPSEPDAQEKARRKYLWARELIARINAGEPVGTAEAEALRRYQTTPAYKTAVQMEAVFGEEFFEAEASGTSTE